MPVRIGTHNIEDFFMPTGTSNTDKIGEIALSAVRAGADGITAINTVGPEKFYEPVAGKPVLYNHDGHRGSKSGRFGKCICQNPPSGSYS